MRKIKLIQQMGVTDCGLACLSMIFNYYGYKIDLPTLSSEVTVGRDGLTIIDMKEIAEKKGFKLKVYSCNLEDTNLYSNVPLIFCTNENHYVIAEKRKKGKVKINDPNFGIYYILIEEVVENYKNIALIIRPVREKYFSNIRKMNLKIHIPYKYIFKFAVYTLLIEGLILISPLLINYIIDLVEASSKIPNKQLIVVLLIAGSIYFLISRLRKKTIITMQSIVYEDVFNSLIKKILNLDIYYFYGHTYGDVINRINNLNIINNIIASTVFTIVVDVITAIVCFLVIVKLSFEIALVLGILTALLTFSVFCIGLILRRENNIFMMIQSKMQGILFNNISSIEQVRSLGIEDVVENKIKLSNSRYIAQYKKKETYNMLLESLIATITWILVPMIYLGGGWLVQFRKITLGELTSIVTVASLFIRPFITISLYYPQFNMCLEIFSRIKEIMLAGDKGKCGNVVVTNFERLELRNIRFSYANSNIRVLFNINICIKKGDKIAIVGSSGSGKSTIAKIIVNLYNTYGGQILINGIPNGDIDVKNLGRMFSIVTQTPFVFNGTIRENIDVIGEFDDSYIYKILKIVSLYEAVKSFPLKLNTTVGENGQNISGGQKQRIAIARALLYSPAVIIFDEGTSNLDPVTEHVIYDNIKQLHITQIVITHRLNTIADSDNIYVLERGHIVEEGNHNTLIELDGHYAKAFKLYS